MNKYPLCWSDLSLALALQSTHPENKNKRHTYVPVLGCLNTLKASKGHPADGRTQPSEMSFVDLSKLLHPMEVFGRSNQEVIVDAKRSPGASNLPDVLNAAVLGGYSKENLLRLFIDEGFMEQSPLLTVVFPRRAGTAADLTRRFPELIFDPTAPERLGERGRAPIVAHHIVEHKSTIERFALGFDTTMFTAEQKFGDGSQEFLTYLVAFVIKQVENGFQINALLSLFDVENDSQRGLYRGQHNQGKTLEEYMETKFKLFGIFDKSSQRGMTTLVEMRQHINQELTINRGTKINTIVVRDTLAQRLVSENPNHSVFAAVGPEGKDILESSMETISQEFFKVLGSGTSPGYTVLPIKDTSAMLNIFKQSLMTRLTCIGQYYPFVDRTDQMGTPNWKHNFETIHIWDAAQKQYAAISKMQALRSFFDQDTGLPKSVHPSGNLDYTPIEDYNGKYLDMFYDLKDNEKYNFFGNWSYDHLSLDNLNRWVKQVVVSLEKNYKDEVNRAKTGLAQGAFAGLVTNVQNAQVALNTAQQNFNAADQAFLAAQAAAAAPGGPAIPAGVRTAQTAARQDLLVAQSNLIAAQAARNIGYDAGSLITLLRPIFSKAIQKYPDDATIRSLLASGPQFLGRDVTTPNPGVNVDLHSKAEALVLNARSLFTDVALGGATDGLAIIEGMTPDQISLFAKVLAYRRFGLNIPTKAFADIADYTALVDQAAQDRPDLKDAVDAISQNFVRLFTPVFAVIQGQNAAAIQGIVGVDDTFPTGPLRFLSYQQLVVKNGAWNATNYVPMSLTNPNIPMSQGELADFINKHQSVFTHRAGQTRTMQINSKMSVFSPHMYEQHFSRMNQDPSYRDTFMAHAEKMDNQLLNFFTDSSLISSAVGTEWRQRNQTLFENGPVNPAEFVQELLSASNSHLAEWWNTVSSKFTGIEQIIAKLFLLSPIDLDTLDDWYRNEIPLPFSAFVVADNMWYEAEQMIACAQGSVDMGEFVVVDYRFTRSNDGSNQVTAGMLAAHAGVAFSATGKRNVVNLPDVKLIRAVKGCGTKLLTPEMRLSGKFTMEEGICFHIAPLGTQLPGMWCTSGNLNNDPHFGKLGLAQRKAIPCATRLYYSMEMDRYLEASTREGFKINTLISRGKVRITDDGYTFNNVIPGCSQLGSLDGPYDPDAHKPYQISF